MKSLGVYYGYVKMSQWGCGAWIKIITFYIWKHIAHLAVCSRPPAGSRCTARGTRICETGLLES